MKTNRQKCVEMWEQLAKTGMDKRDLPDSITSGSGPNTCFACKESLDEAERRGKFVYSSANAWCELCPVKWVEESETSMPCRHSNSPYFRWIYCSPDRMSYWAEQVLECVRLTWKEES